MERSASLPAVRRALANLVDKGLRYAGEPVDVILPNKQMP